MDQLAHHLQVNDFHLLLSARIPSLSLGHSLDQPSEISTYNLHRQATRLDRRQSLLSGARDTSNLHGRECRRRPWLGVRPGLTGSVPRLSVPGHGERRSLSLSGNSSDCRHPSCSGSVCGLRRRYPDVSRGRVWNYRRIRLFDRALDAAALIKSNPSCRMFTQDGSASGH
jgi:hypothetical protein